MKTCASRSFPLSWLVLPALIIVVGCGTSYKTPRTADREAYRETDVVNSAADHSDADNTARNITDRSTNALTASDQGGSQPDREISRKIRKAVVSGDNNYSVAARNVKIITIAGKVTLRGPVSTDLEKSGIEMIAKSVAGDGNVDNQLEVKTP